MALERSWVSLAVGAVGAMLQEDSVPGGVQVGEVDGFARRD